MARLFIFCVGISLCATYTLAVGSAEIKCFSRRHEVEKCVNECPPERTCKNKDVKFSCHNIDKECEPKCVCEDGYFRNPLGDCISTENCERCSGEHEYYSCGGFCDNVCSNLREQNKTHCPVVNIVCNQKCYCEDGYARDERNRCIPIAECSQNSEERN
ncbi:inducible metalloproteinase inhibitor protein-like [Aricia agestis]|uniref:inducible metalloproteinase inhibitor protein-like n=1 Tax=Aricia agestis TaxID=91739 RepID=UPI001C2075E9|nr:inducible metalloproteinase inhibitor protein-like [Aricia agestis]XP_041976027.1 inducible metalloproteinase inhibitor protein-like [Aricia agestis]